jgi:DNA-binding XRE family transcriptional regulator
MEYDKNKSVQLLNLMDNEYVLVRKETYDELLDKLEALDTSLVITRSREQASQDVLKAMLKGNFSVEQIREVAKTRTIGERIRLIRKIRNLAQRKLAEKSGLSQTAISNLENDLISEPSFASLDAVFEGLQVPAGAVYALLKTGK